MILLLYYCKKCYILKASGLYKLKGNHMSNLAELLEQELEEAVEVKNRKSLHRYILLLADNIVQKGAYEHNILEIRNEIKLLAETMKQGFESVDKRFEDMSKRFSLMFAFMNIGLGIIILITVLFKFIQ